MDGPLAIQLAKEKDWILQTVLKWISDLSYLCVVAVMEFFFFFSVCLMQCEKLIGFTENL